MNNLEEEWEIPEIRLPKNPLLLDMTLCILRIVEEMIIIRDFCAFLMDFYAKID